MIKALGKRIIVEVVNLETPKASLLLIVPTGKELITARVIAVGSEVDHNVDYLDIVYLYPGTGREVKIDGSEYLSITEDQVLAAWKDK
jgi:co-chaperonin GroES (HSP10)